jgi:amidase
MARTVEDAAILLQALAGADPRDQASVNPRRPQAEYRASLDVNGLKGARIGVPRAKFFGYSDGADSIANAAIAKLQELGAVIVDPADIPNAGTFDDDEMEVMLYEYKAGLNSYLGGLGPSAKVHSLEDGLRSTKRTDRENCSSQPGHLLRAQKKGR